MTSLTANGLEELESPDAAALDVVLSTGFEDGKVEATVRVRKKKKKKTTRHYEFMNNSTFC